MVWNRDLSGKCLNVIQQVATLYSKWIAPLIDCGPEAELLVAASLSMPRLRQLVEDVTFAILESSPRQTLPKGVISHHPTMHRSEEEARTGLLSVIEAIQCISVVIAGKECEGEFEQLDNLSDDRHIGLGNDLSRWSPLVILSHALLVRALEEDWSGMRSRLQRLPMKNVLHSRLESGLRLAAKELLAFSKKVARGTPGVFTQRDAYFLALAALTDVTASRCPQPWQKWYAATEQIHSAGQEWRRVRWVEAHGNQANESLRVQMLKKESRVRQYALMMRGNGERLRAVKLLKALHMLLQSARRDAIHLGGRWSGGPSKRLQARFDVDIVEPDLRAKWEMALAGPLRKYVALIRIATRDGQNEPWKLERYYGQFVKKGLVGGTSDAYRKRHIVEELLAPMQALGLAANLPWEPLLQADGLRRRARARRNCDTLETCHGKAWVVNPLGIVPRLPKRSSRR